MVKPAASTGCGCRTIRAGSGGGRRAHRPSDTFYCRVRLGTVRVLLPISRIARATTSARAFHSGDPGEASGRQRLQARKPARCAAAELR